jgi:hypothetical protein
LYWQTKTDGEGCGGLGEKHVRDLIILTEPSWYFAVAWAHGTVSDPISRSYFLYFFWCRIPYSLKPSGTDEAVRVATAKQEPGRLAVTKHCSSAQREQWIDFLRLGLLLYCNTNLTGPSAP